MLLRVGVASLLFAGTLCAQIATPATDSRSPADQLVDQLVENARLYRATLPALMAKETIHSEVHSSIGLFNRKDDAEATVRVTRKTADGPWEESREFTLLNRKPVAPGAKIDLPVGLTGGFGNLQETFFSARFRPCFDFLLLPQANPNGPLELRIAPKPIEDPTHPCPRHDLEGLTALALVEPQGHHLTHLEWGRPTNIADKMKYWAFISVDLAPTHLGGKTYWLPTLVTAKGQGEEWIAHYSDYHLFTASSTILPTAP